MKIPQQLTIKWEFLDIKRKQQKDEMTKTKAPKNPITGRNLKIALNCLEKSPEIMANSEIWKDDSGLQGPTAKTIRRWQKEGLSETNLLFVAKVFDVPSKMFLVADRDMFEKAIREEILLKKRKKTSAEKQVSSSQQQKDKDDLKKIPSFQILPPNLKEVVLYAMNLKNIIAFIVAPFAYLLTKTKTAHAYTHASALKSPFLIGFVTLAMTIGVALYDRNEFKLVNTFSTCLISIHDSEPKFYYLRAWAEKKLSRYSDAIADFDKMMELASQKKDDKLMFNALCGKGIMLNRMGNYTEAVDIFSRANKINPTDKDTLYFLSDSLSQSGKTVEATKIYNELQQYYSNILKKDPTDLWALRRQGFILSKLKNYEESLQILSRALTIDPDLETTLFHRGNVYYCLGKYQKAIEDYNRSLKLNPYDEDVYRLRAHVYGSLKRYDEQLNDLNKRIEIKPNSSNAYMLRALFFRSQKKYPAAIADLEEAIKNSPNKSIYFEHRGDIYSQLKKYPEAASDYIEALKLNSDNANLQTKIRMVIDSLIKHGETDVALNYLNIIIKNNPKNETSLVARGSLFLQLKQLDRALQDFEKALEINPKDMKALENKKIILSLINQ